MVVTALKFNLKLSALLTSIHCFMYHLDVNKNIMNVIGCPFERYRNEKNALRGKRGRS